MITPSKRDWKLYQEKIKEWQEHYMEKLVKEYADYLCSEIPASTKFWELEKRIKRDKKNPGVLIELSKSDMLWDIVGLIRRNVITIEDLVEFSDELKNEYVPLLNDKQKDYINITIFLLLCMIQKKKCRECMES